MPTVIFERGERGEALVVEVPEGGALVDVCDDNAAPVPFSCKDANCGTCLVVILEGAAELLPPERAEIAVLRILAAPPTQRLACQAKMKPGLLALRLRAVGDGE